MKQKYLIILLILFLISFAIIFPLGKVKVKESLVAFNSFLIGIKPIVNIYKEPPRIEVRAPRIEPVLEEPLLIMTNPSATYCQRVLGYEYKTVTNKATGGQYGVCVMPNGKECRAWDFYGGKCGQQFNYCGRKGYQTIAKSDGKDSFSPEYTVCVLNNQELGSVTRLSNLLEVIQGKVSPQPLPK